MTRCRCAAAGAMKLRIRCWPRRAANRVERFLRDWSRKHDLRRFERNHAAFIAREALDPHLKVGGRDFSIRNCRCPNVRKPFSVPENFTAGWYPRMDAERRGQD